MRVWFVLAFLFAGLLVSAADATFKEANKGDDDDDNNCDKCLLVQKRDQNYLYKGLAKGESAQTNQVEGSSTASEVSPRGQRTNESSSSAELEGDNEVSGSILKLSHQQPAQGEQPASASPRSASGGDQAQQQSSSSNSEAKQTGSHPFKGKSKLKLFSGSSSSNSNNQSVLLKSSQQSNSKKSLLLSSLLLQKKSKRTQAADTTRAPSQGHSNTKQPAGADSPPSPASFDPFLTAAGSVHQQGALFAPHIQAAYPTSYPPPMAAAIAAAAAAAAAANQNMMHFEAARQVAVAKNHIQQQQQQQQAQMMQQQQQQQQQQAAQQSSIDQIAAQSIEHSQRAAQSSSSSSGGNGNINNNELPIYFATSNGQQPATGGQQDNRQQQEDKTGAGITLVQAPALALNGQHHHQSQQHHSQQQQHHHHQHHHQQQHQHQHQSAAAAAAALIGERAKNLFGHIGASGGHLLKAATSASGHSSGSSANGGGGFTGLLKGEAAESWGTATGVGPTAGTTPTIIVEHDGPSITTVDFNSNNFRGRLVPNANADDEDESSFYAAEEDEESLGSHEAGRVAPKQLRQQQQQQLQQQSQRMRLRQPATTVGQQAHANSLAAFYGHQASGSNSLRGRLQLQQQQQQQARLAKLGRPNHLLGGQEVVEDAVRDYMRFQRVIDQQQPAQQQHQQEFPDSINAIKEQEEADGSEDDENSVSSGGSNGGNGKSNLASAIKAKLVNSSDNQIEQLIKELQDLNESKRNNKGNNREESGGSRRPDSREPRPARDEYDDYDDDDDDEETRVLRRKLMSRLRHKQHRKRGLGGGGGGSMSASASIMQDPAVKIPLHALLMAALDRRMSPSELISRSVASADSGGGGGGGGADGSLLARPSSSTTTTTTTTTTPPPPTFVGDYKGASALIPEGDQHFLETDFDDENGLALLGGASNGRREHSPSSVGGYGNKQTTSNLNAMLDVVQRPVGAGEALGEGQLLESAATTPMPMMISRHSHLQQAGGGGHYLPANNSQSNYNSTKARRETSRGGEANANASEGDFDIDKQVEEFARDRGETAQLEPSWIRQTERGGGVNNGRPNGKQGSRQSDSDPDEADEDEYSSSSDLSRRGKRPRGRGGGSGGGGGGGGGGEDSYDANENKFFDRLQRETREDDDIDKNTSGIEDPIAGASDAGSRQRRRPQDSSLDSDGGDSDADDQEDVRQVDSERDYDMDGARRGSESRVKASRASWRPQMVDDEVSRIEELARLKAAEREREERRKRRRRRRKGNNGATNGDYYSGNDDDDDGGDGDGDADAEEEPPDNSARRFEDGLESRVHETTAQPAKTTVTLTVNSSDETGGDANVTQINLQHEQQQQSSNLSSQLTTQNNQKDSPPTTAPADSIASKGN